MEMPSPRTSGTFLRRNYNLELSSSATTSQRILTHRNKDAATALKTQGQWFLYRPPYSPDLNPTGLAFLKLKTHLRRIGARTFDQIFGALAEICNRFTPQEC